MKDYCFQIASGKDNFDRIAKDARNKANGSILGLAVKAFMGGWFVSVGGYAALYIASLFYEANTPNPGSKVAFAIVFPSALAAILYTGTDLYTGNTMCFTFALISGKISPLTYASKLLLSMVGNFIGASFGALVLVGGTGHFLRDYGAGASYMMALAKGKTTVPFWRLMFSAVGCNTLVCLAIWSFYSSHDSAGAMLNIFAQIGTFAVGRLEHIIANFFMLNSALVSKAGVSFMDVYVRNFIPVWIGNTIAGVFFMGVPLSVLHYLLPQKNKLEHSEKLENEEIYINSTVL